jgi:hypothetical protein
MLSSYGFVRRDLPFNLTINNNNLSRQHGNGCIGIEIVIGIHQVPGRK